jgi:hypothetical protein
MNQGIQRRKGNVASIPRRWLRAVPSAHIMRKYGKPELMFSSPIVAYGVNSSSIEFSKPCSNVRRLWAQSKTGPL